MWLYPRCWVKDIFLLNRLYTCPRFGLKDLYSFSIGHNFFALCVAILYTDSRLHNLDAEQVFCLY